MHTNLSDISDITFEPDQIVRVEVYDNTKYTMFHSMEIMKVRLEERYEF